MCGLPCLCGIQQFLTPFSALSRGFNSTSSESILPFQGLQGDYSRASVESPPILYYSVVTHTHRVERFLQCTFIFSCVDELYSAPTWPSGALLGVFPGLPEHSGLSVINSQNIHDLHWSSCELSISYHAPHHPPHYFASCFNQELSDDTGQLIQAVLNRDTMRDFKLKGLCCLTCFPLIDIPVNRSLAMVSSFSR